MKATETERQIIEERASELEKIGFTFNCNSSSVWYEKGEVKMPATLMMCAPTKDWNDFILKHTDKSPDESPIKEDGEDELWKEVYKIIHSTHRTDDAYAKLKYKFHITRKQ